MKNLYVGNLDYATTEEQLRALFLAYGVVETVSLVRDRDTGNPRGFAFVEMSNDEEADKAITAVNGLQVAGRALYVTEARPKTVGSGTKSGKREHRRNHF
jgi:RNA recognition motif-containing protein